MPEYNTLADELQRLVDVTDAIGEAIANQGGTVDYYDRLEQYPADIATIATNIGTKTITDDSTIEFVGDGNPLLEYTIKGNMVQSGTPTPISPITPSETGDKTANLFDIASWIKSNGTTYTKSGDSYTFDTKQSMYSTPYYFSETDIAISISGILENVSSVNARIDLLHADGTVSSGNVITDSRTKSENIYAAGLRFNWSTGGTVTLSNIMLNTDSSALPYEPFGYKIPFDINDSTVNMYLGEVETTRRIKKLVLTGNETWYTEGSDIFYTDRISDAYRATPICTHFKGVSSLANNNDITISATLRINIKTDYVTHTVNDFKTYLQQQYSAGTPVTVWYVLAEPTTGVVDEPLRKIGDYVDIVTGPPPTVPTIEGTNTLKVETTLNPSETFIKYRYIENVALLGEKTITTDGVYNATDDNLDGYSSVTVNVAPTIISKNITSDGVYNASADDADGYSPVTVEVTPPINAIIEPADDALERALGDGITPPTPVPPTVPEGTVRFIDYDGSVLHEYPSRVFLGSTSLPANPTHTGLTAQGWNWSLSDAKTYVTAYGSLDIGQMYARDTTLNSDTLLHIRLGDGRLKPYLGLTGDSSGTAVSIEWGDGSAVESVTLDTNTVYTPHEYSTSGDYTIIITVDTGSITLTGDTTYFSNILRKSVTPNVNNDKVYQNSLINVEIGNNVSIGQNAFRNCTSLTSITIPNTVTSISGIAFYNCTLLQAITIPDTVTSIGANAFQYCFALKSITIPSSVTSIGNNAFRSCSSLTYIAIPDTVTDISIGTNTFNSCYSLQSITIPNSVTSISSQTFNNCYSLQSITIPDTVTSIGANAFQNCYSLASIAIPNSVTSIGGNAFYNCYSLKSNTIPSSVTSIGNNAFYNCQSLTLFIIPDSVTTIGSQAFQNCYALTSITIPDGVTSIGSSAFISCYTLQSITIPDTVTSIDAQAFDSCYGLGYIKFESTTPPTVSNSNAWTALPTDCIIMVPTGSLTAYTTATNYPDPNTYTYVEY